MNLELYMKENKRPQVRPITREEWLDMLISEQQTPTEKENVSILFPKNKQKYLQ